MANTRTKRKKTLKKGMKKAGGLLGRAGRGLMGRGRQIEEAVYQPKTTRKKPNPAKKKKRTR